MDFNDEYLPLSNRPGVIAQENPLTGAYAYTTGVKPMDITNSPEGGTYAPEVNVSLKENHMYGAEAALDAHAKSTMEFTAFSHAETESDFYFPLQDGVNVRHLRLIHVTMRILTPGVDLLCIGDGIEVMNRPYLRPMPGQ